MTMHRSMTAIMCLALLIMCSLPCFGQGGQTATISIEKIYNASSRLKAAVDEVNKIRTEAAGKVATISAAAKLLQSRLKKEAKKLKPEEMKRLKEDLQAKRKQYETERETLRAKIDFKQKSVQNVLNTQLPIAVDKIAKQKGISVVLWDRALAYSKGVPDISVEVAKELDKMPALEKGPQDKPPAKKKP